ncbi:hypothetical protein [Piscinibacter sp. HJYY11]|uniref:hypothetical protein n=1 Tax=Piscinibacter sp. HJYY11 TaxID=2801333 RepID=UPI00191CA210|nr:hypothetical protein [Piscinibacter sp. HJYY11]MBL0726085.1 hypothetical protein [Piscinibacter sp. HJYY11]
MKLSSLQIEPEPLTALTVEAGKLLAAGKFSDLAERLGYAVALGRNPATAIQEDLRSSLAELGDTQLDYGAEPATRVKYFKPNDNNLYAVVECVLATTGGHGVLIELVVFGGGNEFHATLEQVSAAA